MIEMTKTDQPPAPQHRPDRSDLSNQSTSTNIIDQTVETLANTTTTPTKFMSKDDDPPAIAVACMAIFSFAFIVTWIYCAVFLKRDTVAFNENSKAFEELKYEMQHSKETVTQTLTAVIHETAEVTKEGYIERITETVTQTVDNHLPTDAWVTKIGNARD
ncbi:hypothetical protein QM012_000121 [Aureobasidium pullulans]|uniref:Uncharacterized protein n=1 Tax=Aureobasidium pullulans TaxID=5580 RepID=A0ABR0TUP2_AURPU